tara:strand:- start:107 stop:316 length:210 start_codon:yes stop_codon:yes gene_type:complete
MDKFKSRKFWFALLGALLPIVAQFLTDDVEIGEAIKLSVGVLVAYIFGQGYVDGKAVEGVVTPDASEGE